MDSMPKRSSRMRKVAVAVVALLFFDQLMLHTVLGDDVLFGNAVAPFEEPLFSELQRDLLVRFEEGLAKDRAAFDRNTQFDAVLGWSPRPGSVQDGAQFDWAGSRVGTGPLPPAESDVDRMVALVGCSFTLGSEVGDQETWACGLDERWSGTRIGNFGVGGYGADQALLRYRRDVAPLKPDEVWFGFFPHAALRVSSQFPQLYLRWRARTVLFKPRFSLNSSEVLELHESPTRRPEDALRLIRDHEAFLDAIGDNDPWIARARPAYMGHGTHWLHYTSLGRVLLTLHERRGRDVPSLLHDKESEVYRLNRAIVTQLAREVEAMGARFRLLVLPGGLELEEVRANGQGHWESLVTDWRGEGIEVFDLSSALLEAGVVAGETYWMPGGHYSPPTHEIVVDAIAAKWAESVDSREE